MRILMLIYGTKLRPGMALPQLSTLFNFSSFGGTDRIVSGVVKT